MTERSFQTRSRVAMRRGDMTMTDMGWWFNRHRATVQAWVKYGHVPTGPAGREAYRALALLEKAIARNKNFPVPPKLSYAQRKEYILRVRPGGAEDVTIGAAQ